MVNYFCFAQNIASCKMSFSIITFFFTYMILFQALYHRYNIQCHLLYTFEMMGLFQSSNGNGFFFIMVRPLTYKDLHSLNLKSLLAPNTCPAKHDKDFFPIQCSESLLNQQPSVQLMNCRFIVAGRGCSVDRINLPFSAFIVLKHIASVNSIALLGQTAFSV